MFAQVSADLHDENQENVQPGKSGPSQGPAGGRVVLGVLQGNRAPRVQPQRSSRQQHQQALGQQGINDENFGKVAAGKAASKQPAFSIHVDEPDGANRKRPTALKKSMSEENLLELTSAVTSLGRRKPLAPIPIECSMDISFDSPMVLDMSVIHEGEEKPVNANEVPDYADDIHTYLREMEIKCRPKAGYMKKQPDITNSMRAILVDWLVEVGEEYKLQNETLYLAVNYIDRFLSSMSVLRGKLQLVGTAAMLLASKFEEIYPPEVAEFVYITDDTYTKKQVLKMEHLVLKVLSFDLAAPTIQQFLTQYFMHQHVSPKVESLCMYLGELSLIDADPFLKYLPSALAAASFILANYTLSCIPWTEPLVQLTGYTFQELKPCIVDLHRTFIGAATHQQQSVREKYKTAKYHAVSLIDPPETFTLS
ncbi:cyclin-A2 isoform X2 [Ambystoma mexicanum]|uniref:Cyclin-A2 n=2 Tax=Ambystoma TaxID=8295 RepID=A0A873A7L7_AMBME|nr:cyclin A2 [Ambystoma mexicanum]QOY46768.1 cyclin A2 [Ambystoma velasci]